jgi:hypothetical protein
MIPLLIFFPPKRHVHLPFSHSFHSSRMLFFLILSPKSPSIILKCTITLNAVQDSTQPKFYTPVSQGPSWNTGSVYGMIVHRATKLYH